MNEMSAQLRHFGDVLERAIEADLARAARVRFRRRRLTFMLVAALVGTSGAAIAGVALIDSGDVARSLPAGTLALAGTHPICTEVRARVEYDCVLDVPPADEVADWAGTVEVAVDRTMHVFGGCRAQDAAGLRWRCYIGHEAVRQGTIAEDLLGQPSPGPASG